MQTPDLVSVEDSSGTVLEEIVLPGGDRDKMLSSRARGTSMERGPRTVLRIEHDGAERRQGHRGDRAARPGRADDGPDRRFSGGKEPPREFKRGVPAGRGAVILEAGGEGGIRTLETP